MLFPESSLNGRPSTLFRKIVDQLALIVFRSLLVTSFQVPDISKHINNIFEYGELTPSTTVSKMETVVQRGFIHWEHEHPGENNFGLYCKLVYICTVVGTDCAAEPGLKNTLNS